MGDAAGRTVSVCVCVSCLLMKSWKKCESAVKVKHVSALFFLLHHRKRVIKPRCSKAL